MSLLPANAFIRTELEALLLAASRVGVSLFIVVLVERVLEGYIPLPLSGSCEFHNPFASPVRPISASPGSGWAPHFVTAKPHRRITLRSVHEWLVGVN